MHKTRLECLRLLYALSAPALFSQTGPNLRILLSERTRLLDGQLIDLVLEVRKASTLTSLRVTVGSTDITIQVQQAGRRGPRLRGRKKSGRSRGSGVRRYDGHDEADGPRHRQTAAHHWPSKEQSHYSVRLKKMPGELLLIAAGTAKPGERTTQLMLIRRSALKTFLPWLDAQLP